MNVLLGPPVTVNVALEIATESSNVTVTTEAPLIQAENGDVSTTMNQKQVSEVTNPGNDLTYIAQTAPGAIMNTDVLDGSGYVGNSSIVGMPGTELLKVEPRIYIAPGSDPPAQNVRLQLPFQCLNATARFSGTLAAIGL